MKGDLQEQIKTLLFIILAVFVSLTVMVVIVANAVDDARDRLKAVEERIGLTK